jgi:hypothetical protein
LISEKEEKKNGEKEKKKKKSPKKNNFRLSEIDKLPDPNIDFL